MKLLKIFFYSMAILVMGFTLVACSPEGVIKKATDGAVDVDKDGNVEIKGEDGEKLKIGEAKWDKTKMYGLDAPKAKLDSFMSTTEGTSYYFSEMKNKDIETYIKKIKKAGFKYNFISMDEFSYTGTNEDGIIVNFTYSKDSNSGMISAIKGEKPTEEEMASGGFIMEGENAKWDSSKIGGLPDPGVKIISFTSSSDNEVSYSFEKLDNPKEYTEEIKAAGYTEEPSEMEASESYIYNAKNSEGDVIYFTASTESCTVVFTKATE